MSKQEAISFCPATKQDWRNWLEQYHQTQDGVWLIVYKKGSKTPNLDWSESVDEALCFGWIDSVKQSVDKDRYKQYFCKRKPNSTWSKINKDKIEVLQAEGLMTEAGLKTIEIAKQNGSWTLLDSVEALIVPQDLEDELLKYPNAMENYQGFSKSTQKSLLYWVISAKRSETRIKRITDIAENASNNEKPKPFRLSR